MVLPSHEEDEMLGQPRRKRDVATQGERQGRERDAGRGRERDAGFVRFRVLDSWNFFFFFFYSVRWGSLRTKTCLMETPSCSDGYFFKSHLFWYSLFSHLNRCLNFRIKIVNFHTIYIPYLHTIYVTNYIQT